MDYWRITMSNGKEYYIPEKTAMNLKDQPLPRSSLRQPQDLRKTNGNICHDIINYHEIVTMSPVEKKKTGGKK